MTEAALQERPVTSRQIKVGGVPIGGGAQVAVQSMTNTMTYDVEATVQQVYDLNAAGAELVRVSVNGSKALNGFREVVWRSPVPLIADIHFDYRMALGAADAGAACVRINPGNVGNDDRYRQVIEKCQETDVAMRIGVNSGSVERKYWDLPKHEALVASALHKVEIAEEMGFFNFKVSLKASHVPEMVQANRQFREHSDAPLHLGVTEAGTKLTGAIKSAAALGQLLPYGMGTPSASRSPKTRRGDTGRVPDPLLPRPPPPRPERDRLPELRPHPRVRRHRAWLRRWRTS
jgi:(E)-4-hydroxy-3-methylbut-2-enyl-diphosphate synthase